MLIMSNAASISIFDCHKKMDEHLEQLHDFLLKNRVLKAYSYESNFNKKLMEFKLLIFNGNKNYVECWTLENKFDSQFSLTLSLDIVRKDFTENVCLKQDIDFISILLKKKFIGIAYFHLGLPKKKKHFFSYGYNESNYMGFEYVLFLSEFKAKYVYNWDLLDKYHNQIKAIIKNHWKDLKQENKIITIKRSELDTFFKNVNTPFSKEIMDIIKI